MNILKYRSKMENRSSKKVFQGSRNKESLIFLWKNVEWGIDYCADSKNWEVRSRNERLNILWREQFGHFPPTIPEESTHVKMLLTKFVFSFTGHLGHQPMVVAPICLFGPLTLWVKAKSPPPETSLILQFSLSLGTGAAMATKILWFLLFFALFVSVFSATDCKLEFPPYPLTHFLTSAAIIVCWSLKFQVLHCKVHLMVLVWRLSSGYVVFDLHLTWELLLFPLPLGFLILTYLIVNIHEQF